MSKADPERLSLIIFSGRFDRVHYALAMASAAAAINRPVTLFFTGRAVRALLPGDGWQGLDAADDGASPLARDHHFSANGIGAFAELLEACGSLGVSILACEMGLRALGLALEDLRKDMAIAPGGLVTLYREGGQLVFVG